MGTGKASETGMLRVSLGSSHYHGTLSLWEGWRAPQASFHRPRTLNYCPRPVRGHNGFLQWVKSLALFSGTRLKCWEHLYEALILSLQETTHHEMCERLCIKLFPSTYPLALSRAITTESRKGVMWVSIPSKFDFQIPLNTKIKVMGKFYVKASTIVDIYILL